MRFLKQLQLQGYKTFASRTEFLFDEGITAIVGPNGSGKSNIADALRWVLGEQSFGSLRAKRTEDMIFSGSDQRARLGMANAILTFDNTSGWLPIDFSEVEIARRAYRSGENEYFINGNRVRLRDLTELLGSCGLSERTYTVIGQGLIDQALSLRPEERRKLFEEAAGITVHQSKRDHAMRQLDEARGNLTRAQDIISELTPRLRYLKGQARRTQEYQQIRADLEAQLQVWYGYRWHQVSEAIGAAQARVADMSVAAEEGAAVLNELLAQVALRQAERARLRDHLGDWHRASSQLHRQAETAQRELAVRSEQHRLLGEQIEELRRDTGRLSAGIDDGAERLQAAQAELAEAQAAHSLQAARVSQAQHELEGREQARKAQAGDLALAQEGLLALKTQLADRRARLAQLGERRVELGRMDGEQAQAAATAAGQAAESEAQTRLVDDNIAAATRQLDALEEGRTAQAKALAAAQAAERSANERLNAAQRALARVQDQHDLLLRLRDEGAGMGAGPRNVLAAWAEQRAERVQRPQRAQPASGPSTSSARDAGHENNSEGAPTPKGAGGEPPQGARSAGLTGIVGALGDLIQVPAELERAFEAALGGRLQDIVVRGWQDAENAVAFLKQRQGGRATFLPLDSLRPGRPVEVPRLPGVLGLGSDLVSYDPSIRAAVDLALNHIVVLQDLPTARRLLGKDNRATLVTVDGEIVRPGGSVTGGSEGNRRDSGILSRARELTELPARIDAAGEAVAAAQRQVAEARQLQRAAEAAVATLRHQQGEIRANRERLAAERNRLHLALERAHQNAAWHNQQRTQASRELAELTSRQAELETTMSGLADKTAAQEAAVESARRALAVLETDQAVAELARQRAQAEISARQRERYAARVDELAAAQRQRRAELAAKEERIRGLSAQQAEASQVITRQSGVNGGLVEEIAVLTRQIEPAEARLAQIEGLQRADEARERNLREHLRLTQLHQNQAELALQRAEDELAHLRGEIEKELGLVAFDEDDLVDNQPPLPLNGLVTRLPTVVELPEGLDRDVRNLRAQVSRLGPVNLEAPAEYAEVETRYNFLTSQAADLDTAVASLEQVITELDRVMEREFLTTFKAVAAEFREFFKQLFGGGTARLVLSDPDDITRTGIEIIARPPGKREQGLALLSGGERALTAAALIFSILKVRPTPFCVLDEVDAALDEANAARFRDALKALSARTQFILITHNRGTIEAADTIYGVTMGPDNTSQVLSLQLEGKEVAPGRVAEAMQAANAAEAGVNQAGTEPAAGVPI
jgi:chromosome segregation protein